MQCLLVSAFLSKPLYQLLGDLCGTQLLRRTIISVLMGQVLELTAVGFKLAGFIRRMPQGLPNK